jgi:hypothetical protein
MVPLGLFYEQVKTQTGNGWRFMLAALAYLLALRAVAELVEFVIKRVRKRLEAPQSDA